MLSAIILTILMIPFISDFHVYYYLIDIFSVFGEESTYYMQQSNFIDSPISPDSVYVCILSLIIIGLVLFLKIGKSNKNNHADIYLSGANIDNDQRKFKGSIGTEVKATSRNMYLENIFGEKLLHPFGSSLNIVLLSLSLLTSIFIVMTYSPVIS